MKLDELVTLVKELSSLESLSGRNEDLNLVKKEYKRLVNREVDSFLEQERINQFLEAYNCLASKESSLLASTYDEKRAIINKARELLTAKNVKKASEEMTSLFQDYNTLGRCSKEQDDELWNEFKIVRDEFYANKKAHYEEVGKQMSEAKAKKETIIEKAKGLLEANNFKQANAEMDKLMEEWKQAGFASKADNDALWESFSSIRKEFYAKRKEHIETLKAQNGAKVAAKEELIKKARIALANSTFTKEEIESVKALRNEWKAVGFAGKENDDRLWNEFQSILDKYFSELKSYRN